LVLDHHPWGKASQALTDANCNLESPPNRSLEVRIGRKKTNGKKNSVTKWEKAKWRNHCQKTKADPLSQEKKEES